MDRNIIYVYSENLLRICDENPPAKQRQSMVHELIKEYHLLNYMEIRIPTDCTDENLRLYHTLDYIDRLKSCSKQSTNLPIGTVIESSKSDERFGLAFDCPKWVGLYEFALAVVGSTLSACDEVINGAKTVINWCGGWHHGQNDAAAGFCYVNDVVLGIFRLRLKFRKILYIDLDVHHGDAVENAFSTSQLVFTLSFHMHGPGFYPGTGAVNECGFGPGKGYAANFPFKSGLCGNLYRKYFVKTAALVFERFKPDVCVVQCGGDVLTGDPLGGVNLTPSDLGYCLQYIKEQDLPMVILGGGGYNLPNTSRYWTYLTALLCQKTLSNDIPDNKFFLSFGPGYDININPNTARDYNTEAYMESIYHQIENNLKEHKVKS